MRILRDGTEERLESTSIDDYRAEVDDLQAAILDGTPPRVDLAFSRGSIATLVALDGSPAGVSGLIGDGSTATGGRRRRRRRSPDRSRRGASSAATASLSQRAGGRARPAAVRRRDRQRAGIAIDL